MADKTAPALDINANTAATDQEPFTLVPVIADLVRTRFCAPGTIFVVEGVDVVPLSKSGRWQAVRLMLGDGELCMQALLTGPWHRFVETGEVSVGSCIKVDKFNLEWEYLDPEEQDVAGEGEKMVYLVLHDIATVGWNESYRAMARKHRAAPNAADSPSKSPEEETRLKNASPVASASANVAPAPTAKAAAKVKPSKDESDIDFDMDDAFEDFDKLVFPQKPPSKQTASQSKPSLSKSKATVSLPKDWASRQTPLKLTTLRAIPNLPYAQNWTCNVLAIVASLSPVEDSYLPPYKQRTARIADPSTAKQTHLTVFLDPEAFCPAVGSAVLLTGVKNHRFDGGSLKKYASDKSQGQWWFENPVDMEWCDVAGIKEWWAQVQSSVAE